MATKITKIQTRRDTTFNWSTVDPILSVGEIGFETDSGFQGGRMKFGDGQRPWSLLDYYGSGEKGNFNEIANNGPVDPTTTYYPNVPPLTEDVDGIKVANYAATDKGIYVAGLATYNHIFPSLPGVTIGTPNQRFNELYVTSNSIHIGDDTSDEIVLSHVAGATTFAKLFTQVPSDNGGRVDSVTLSPGDEGKGYRAGDILGVEYAFDYPNVSGKGLRVRIVDVDSDGAIIAVEVVDPGAGYQNGQVVNVVFRSQLAITRNLSDGAGTSTTELATKEALQQVNSQTLSLIGIGEEVAPYLQNVPRSLPDSSGITNQSSFNGWTVGALEQLDREKVQVQNCTNQLEGQGPSIDPQTNLPEYKVIINNKAGVINTSFAGIPLTTTLKGGEILYFNDLQQWKISSGGGGGAGGDEEDPIFTQSDAFRIEENTDTILQAKFLQYTVKVGLSAGPEKLMFVDNWDAIPELQ